MSTRVLAAIAIAHVVGCTQASSQAPARDAGTPTVEQCEITPGDIYFAGIEHASSDGRYRVKILDAVPAPPAVGDNTWTVQLLDSAGAPLVARTPTVAATNPARRLPSSRTPTVAAVDASRAIYKIENLLLGVTGVWRVVIADDPDAGASATVQFDFCVAS